MCTNLVGPRSIYFQDISLGIGWKMALEETPFEWIPNRHDGTVGETRQTMFLEMLPHQWWWERKSQRNRREDIKERKG